MSYKQDFNKNKVIDEWIFSKKTSELLNDYHKGIFYAETPNLGILYYNKVGSTFMSTMFRDNQSLEVDGIKIYSNQVGEHKVRLINENQWVWATTHKKDRGILTESLGDFEKITNGTSEKDLIIVTRNPKLKLLSGLIQDTNPYGSILQHPGLFLRGYLSKHHPSVLGISTFRELKELHPNVWEEVFEYYLLGWFKDFNNIKTSAGAHGKLGFNETYYKFLELNPINLDKLTIVDIDSIDGNLETVFKKYHKDLKFPGGVHSNKGRYSDMVSLINKVSKKYKYLVKDIEWEISRDYFYYNLIKEKYGK